MASFLGQIVAGLRCALEPLQNAFQSEEQLRQFFVDLGWDVAVSPASMASIKTGFALESAFDAALTIAQQIEAGGGDEAALAGSLKDAVIDVIDAVKALGTAPPAGLPFPLDQAAFWNEVPRAVGELLLLKFFQTRVAPIYGTLRLLGFAEVTSETPAGPGRVPYRKLAVRWDRIPRLIGDPLGLLQEIYEWDTAQPFEHALALEVLHDFFQSVRFPARFGGVGGVLVERYYAPANPALGEVRSLAIPLASSVSNDLTSYNELGLLLAPIPPKGSPAQPPVGFVVTPLSQGTVTVGGAPTPGIGLTFRGGFHQDAAIGAEIRPSGVELFAQPGSVTLDAELAFAARPAVPWRLLGDPDGFRIEVGGFTAGLALRGQLTSPEVVASVGTGRGANPPKLAVVIQMSGADGFLGQLLGSTPLRLEVGGILLWSSKTGIHFEGAGGFEWAIPLHLDLGVAEISVLTLGLRGGTGGLDFNAGVTGKAMLGPLTVVVENFGLRITAGFDGPSVDLGLGFKPPNGVGLAIDAGVVKGGGYLFFDFDKEEYAGALQLDIAGIVSAAAIGLVTTRLPDGSKGFSMLIIITAEFGTGLQLGYGFTLLGVGGLLGLNRTMRLQPLVEGVRTGAVNDIMFPRDVVANAPRIISDLRAIFPPQEGTFLIGPMAKLGWGTPTLVSLALGVIIEIPGNIAILGVLRVALPTDDAPVVKLQVSFVGAIEFDKKRVYFFASLFESRVLFMTLEGEMGLLAAFGEDANFVLSVGGFHPRFNPPPLPFPTPVRLAIVLINTDWARVRIAAYFAVTSNTAQFGAHAELFFGFDAINVQGEIGFDALLQFSPFYFIIEFSASFSVTVFGIGLFGVRVRASLEGPTPWRARGTGSISLLFFDISADFDVTWGEEDATTLPPIAVMPLVRAELDKADNWRALPPAQTNLMVSLGTVPPAAGLVLHPVGVLRVSQRAVPLELTLDKVGNQKPSDVKRVALRVVPGGLGKKGDALEQFAPAQFQKMSDAEKLSRPAYVPERGGVELSVAGAQWASSRMVRRVVRYEQIIIDTNFKRFVRRFFALTTTLFTFFLGGASVTRSELSRASRKKLQPFHERIGVRDDTWTVAYQSTNAAYKADAVAFVGEASARDYLDRQVAADPSLADTLHVIPDHERAA